MTCTLAHGRSSELRSSETQISAVQTGLLVGVRAPRRCLPAGVIVLPTYMALTQRSMGLDHAVRMTYVLVVK